MVIAPVGRQVRTSEATPTQTIVAELEAAGVWIPGISAPPTPGPRLRLVISTREEEL